jgi:anti-anti-sigma factor
LRLPVAAGYVLWAATVTAPDYLAITAERDGQRYVLRLKGELDVCNTEQLRRAIRTALEDDVPLLVMDLSALAFMDCSGLSVLVWAQERLIAQRRQLRVTGCQPIVRRLIFLAGREGYLHLSVPMRRAPRSR